VPEYPAAGSFLPGPAGLVGQLAPDPERVVLPVRPSAWLSSWIGAGCLSSRWLPSCAPQGKWRVSTGSLARPSQPVAGDRAATRASR
jgi:hypothetical protein